MSNINVIPLKAKRGDKEWVSEDLEIIIKTLKEGKVFNGCTENGSIIHGTSFSISPSKEVIKELEDKLNKLA